MDSDIALAYQQAVVEIECAENHLGDVDSHEVDIVGNLSQELSRRAVQPTR
jgi:hypothetical protein